jgi:carboxypeptidase PM20D1
MTFIYVPIALIIFTAAWMLLRTLSLQKIPADAAPAEKPQVDREKVSRHLSEAIQVKTISKPVMTEEDRTVFLEMHTWIEKAYPMLTQKLERISINTYSLLYKWQGSEPKLKPVLLNAHMDVVPVDEKTRNEWKYEPFGGEIRDGFVWGRGTLDMKGIMVGLLESAEKLLESGYEPKRTIYLTFGHDEEISGFQGSLKIMEYLKSKGVQLASVLDEGGMLTLGSLTDTDTPVALIGTTEKGYLTVKLSADGKPGHSSRPPRQTAVGIISRAIAMMDDNRMPATLKNVLPTLKKIGYLLPFSMQFAVANAGILRRMLVKELEKLPETNALIRTTHAATVIEGGIKDNILPAFATATVNMRLLPGDTIEGALDHFGKAINDPRVKIEIANEASGWEASKISSTEDPAYLTLELVVRQIFDNVPVAPFVFLAATDSRFYQPICNNIYKFSPYLITPEDQTGIHGINERISQDTLAKMVAFYLRLMRVWGDAEF